jgi:hypothetical protein
VGKTIKKFFGIDMDQSVFAFAENLGPQFPYQQRRKIVVSCAMLYINNMPLLNALKLRF